MNYRLCSKYLGHFSAAIGLLMVPSALWAVYFQEWDALLAFVLATTSGLVFGLCLMVAGRNAPPRMYQSEALFLVAFCWLLAAALGSLPYVYSGLFGLVDAYFEAMSGFTTTGSTVLVDIEATDKSLLFWRSFTHWLGGMGIVVLFIAVLPYLGAGGKQMFKSEAPGPNPQGLQPRIKNTASILYKIYLALTIVQTAALMLCGMTFFDALCHTFGTLATGGFSTRQASIAAFDSVAIDSIIIFFMVCAGGNFALYFAMIRRDLKAPLRDTEWRTYIAIMAISTVAITISLLYATWYDPAQSENYAPLEALRYASFQVVSVMTTTGYGTANFDTWPYFARTLLVALMFVGGCAGSTGGGLKVVRIVMLVKMALWRLERTFRPKNIRAIRISGVVIEDEAQHMASSFFFIYIIWFALGCVFMSALGLPFETAITSVAATLNNIGPGLEQVGAIQDYHHIPATGKIFLSLCMAMGRLELISILVLFMPSFWTRG